MPHHARPARHTVVPERKRLVSDPSADTRAVIDALRQEGAQLDQPGAELGTEQWALDTPAPAWTVAHQRAHRADLALCAEGADADQWLDIAQAFAGPPGNGRAPGGVRR